jgi:hypothetical protein
VKREKQTFSWGNWDLERVARKSCFCVCFSMSLAAFLRLKRLFACDLFVFFSIMKMKTLVDNLGDWMLNDLFEQHELLESFLLI